MTFAQIRGVASKQLVQDTLKTVPATFLSFQQVLCPLPTLDIHSNKERHRFDLRDNTDQTRMFVKVGDIFSPEPEELVAFVTAFLVDRSLICLNAAEPSLMNIL